MFDLFWDFDRLSKVERKSKQRSWDLDPLFRDFWVLGLCNGYGDVGPWVYPCLGPFCNV
jgi:hypothetical protein